MKVCLQAFSEYSHRILYSRFVVHNVALRQYMKNLLSNIHRDLVHIIDQMLNIITGNLIIIGVPVYIPPVTDRFYMLSGDPHKYFIKFDARLLNCIFRSGLDCIDGLFDIENNPSFYTLGKGLTDAQDFKFSLFI